MIIVVNFFVMIYEMIAELILFIKNKCYNKNLPPRREGKNFDFLLDPEEIKRRDELERLKR